MIHDLSLPIGFPTSTSSLRKAYPKSARSSARPHVCQTLVVPMLLMMPAKRMKKVMRLKSGSSKTTQKCTISQMMTMRSTLAAMRKARPPTATPTHS